MRTEEEMTPLLLAAEMGTLEVVRTLLQADPQPDIAAINERNHTALMRSWPASWKQARRWMRPWAMGGRR